jgi:phage terminase large subunit GpA-like protein
VTAPHAAYVTSAEGLTALASVFTRAHRMYQPPPDLTLSQWADRFAYIPKATSAYPGKFTTAFAEYQRGMQDAITHPDVETVVFMLCAQSGKTQLTLNAIGYYAHWEPSPILVVQTSLGEAEKFSKKRLTPTIAETPVLKKLFPPARSRDSGNTQLSKEFPGGNLTLAGANAPAGLASLPIRVAISDEVDRWEETAGKEGDQLDLIDKRLTSFWNRKHIMASTPGIKNFSRIERAYDSSDKRQYFVPCPHCREMQVLEWKRLQWKLQPAGPNSLPRVADYWYVCINGCEIRERSKHEMIRNGEWRASSSSHDGKTVGFHLNALYSPVVEWSKLIHSWLQAQGSLERMKVFINTNLAETWEIRGTGANMTDLEARKEDFREKLPSGVLFLTAGVDVQDNRLECSVIGWGIDDERWVIDHRTFSGDPSMPDTDANSPWAALRIYLREPWDHALGVTMGVACALIDSGGHHTERVYEFCRKYELLRWFPIVGRSGIGKPLASSGTAVGPFKTKLYTVGTDTAKEDIFTSFRAKESGAGYCHFSTGLGPEYFRQVTAEKLVTYKKDFVTTLRWVKTGERNEALDCFVYARAAVAVLRPNFRKIAKNLFRQSEELRAKGEGPKDEAMPAAPTPKPIKPAPLRSTKTPSVADQLRNNFNVGRQW